MKTLVDEEEDEEEDDEERKGKENKSDKTTKIHSRPVNHKWCFPAQQPCERETWRALLR